MHDKTKAKMAAGGLLCGFNFDWSRVASNDGCGSLNLEKDRSMTPVSAKGTDFSFYFEKLDLIAIGTSNTKKITSYLHLYSNQH